MSLLGVLCIFKGHHWPPPNWSIHRSIKLADIQTIGQFLTPLVGALTGLQFDNLLPYRGSVEVYSFSLKYVSPPHPVLGERSSCHSDRHAMTVCVQSYIQMRISTWNGKKLNIFVASAHRTAYRYVGNEFPAEFASWPGVKRKRWRRCRWRVAARNSMSAPMPTTHNDGYRIIRLHFAVDCGWVRANTCSEVHLPSVPRIHTHHTTCSMNNGSTIAYKITISAPIITSTFHFRISLYFCVFYKFSYHQIFVLLL